MATEHKINDNIFSSPTDANAIIQLLKPYFKDQPVRKAYLFGSFARNEATVDSDLDVLVEMKYEAIETGLEYFLLWEELERVTNRSVDLVTTQGLSPYVSSRVEDEKLLIYAEGEA